VLAGRTSPGSTRTEFDSEILVKPHIVCKRVAFNFELLLSVDKLFSLDIDLTPVIDFHPDLVTTYYLAGHWRVVNKLKSQLLMQNVWHTNVPKS
jgi:hypothetical protein